MEALKNLVRASCYGIGMLPGVGALARPWKGIGAILCYHQVLPGDQIRSDVSPNRGLAVSVERFEEQMRYISENYNVVSMDRMVEHIQSGGKEFFVAVTFDDGYKDNYLYAYPILKKYGIPATIYVITRFLEGDTSMWWWELWERLVNAKNFALQVGGKQQSWHIDGHFAKIRCFKEIRRLLLGSEKPVYLDLLRQISADTPQQYPDQCMTFEEIALLDREGLITIGAHTHSHFCLASLTGNEVAEEISKSREMLEEMLSHPIRHFAYPYGKNIEVGRMAPILARKCGMVSAVTTECGNIGRQSDVTLLPRLSMQEYLTPAKMAVLMGGIASLGRRCF